MYPVFFERENIRIYGLSLVTVDHEWSAGEFYAYARQIIERADRENRAVFVVGGTGLYHTHLFGNDKQFFVPPNAEIRTSAEAMSVTQLQEWLTAVAPERLLRMNNSDAHNPRRLVRAIEIAMGLGVHDEVTPQAVEGENTPGRHLFLGLSLDSDTLKQKIEQRVIARFESGALAEVAELLVNDRALSEQVKTTLGFTEITCYLEKKYSAEECKENWIQADFQYSKRQQLWWKKYPEVTWFDKNITNWQESFLSHASGLFLSI